VLATKYRATIAQSQDEKTTPVPVTSAPSS
jgi:hypothetical protein